MKRHVMRFVAAASLTAMIAACSSGGGGSTPAPGATATASTVSGTIVAASTASASKSAAITDGVAVQLVSYDKSGNKLDEKPAQFDSGRFSTQLNLSSTGGYVLIIATKDGYTQYQKRIDYATPGDLELQVAMERIAFAKEVTVSAVDPTVIGKSSEQSFDFAVIRYTNGTKKAVAGKSAILAAKSAADATLEMGISIPASSLPGVTSIDVKASTYDPATNTLPGSYTATDSSGKEGKMVSLAFDYLDLKANTTEGPKNLGKVAKALVKSGVKKAADKATTYTRSIYPSSCKNLFAYDDYNATASGRQVPVWSLNPSTGKWVFIGEGTVTDNSGATIATPTEASCGNGGYYLTILVANSEFERNYWNLDHIVFDTPTKVCLSGTFAAGTTPLARMGLSLSGGNIDNIWGYTNANGEYNLETVILNKKDTTRTASLYFYDADGIYQAQSVTLDASYPTCTSFSKTDFQVPCSVSGTLVDENGAGVAYRNITFTGTNFYKGTGTDANGAFNSKVKCGETINVNAGERNADGSPKSSATFNVNSVQDTYETSDDGKAVVLANITAPNMAPTGYAYFANSSINLLKTSALTAFVSGYDGDNNYPLTWTLKIGDSITKTGTIAATDAQPVEVSITGLAVGTYAATYELKDSKGASSGTINLGNVYVASGNRPPITQLYASTYYVKACSTDRTINLYGSASDADGDAMTGAWSLDGGTAPSCTGKTATAGLTLSDSCQTTLPQGNGPYTYRYTVTDSNSKSGASTASIGTYNNAPVVTLKADKTLVAAGATGADRVVSLTAVATDPDGDTIINKAWSVDGVPSNCIGTTCSYTIPDSATTGQVFVFKYEASDCAATGSNTVKVVYGQAADVTVVVQ